jgi:hypothetical protein
MKSYAPAQGSRHRAHRLSAFFALALGLLMLAQWAFFLATGQVPEVREEPRALAFHLTAELLTALALIAAGAGLLRGWGMWPRILFPVALGMVLYSVVASAGYFAQLRAWGLVGMFAVLFLLSLASLAPFFRDTQRAP